MKTIRSNHMTLSFAWLRTLLANSRFWILAISITASVNIAGFIQLQIATGSLQTIRIEQVFGFVSLFLLYLAIIISPLTKVFPKIPGKEKIIHARRAIGVSAFYYAALHIYITFFEQLNGFSGIRYLTSTYDWSLLLGLFTFGILFIMAATSFDWIVAKLSYKYWKRMHRLVYAASIALLGHVLLIGPHFDDGLTFLGLLIYVLAAVLLVLEILRIRIVLKERHRA